MLRSPLPSRSLFAAFALLAACGGDAVAQSTPEQPASAAAAIDPVAAAVTEASRRFGVPEHWIRAVIRVESAGRADAVSRAGAMGLMQVMPGTYAELRTRYRLGPDPFAVRDNILAGTAYLREMYDRYGRYGMLAAYNAGPGRWEDHLATGRPLPAETVGYLARLAPTVGAGAVERPASDVAVVAPSPHASPLFVRLASIVSAVRAAGQSQSVASSAAVPPRSDDSADASDRPLSQRPIPAPHPLFAVVRQGSEP